MERPFKGYSDKVIFKFIDTVKGGDIGDKSVLRTIAIAIEGRFDAWSYVTLKEELLEEVAIRLKERNAELRKYKK